MNLLEVGSDVLQTIVGFLDSLKSVAALRLTCRTLRTVISGPFYERTVLRWGQPTFGGIILPNGLFHGEFGCYGTGHHDGWQYWKVEFGIPVLCRGECAGSKLDYTLQCDSEGRPSLRITHRQGKILSQNEYQWRVPDLEKIRRLKESGRKQHSARQPKTRLIHDYKGYHLAELVQCNEEGKRHGWSSLVLCFCLTQTCIQEKDRFRILEERQWQNGERHGHYKKYMGGINVRQEDYAHGLRHGKTCTRFVKAPLQEEQQWVDGHLQSVRICALRQPFAEK